MEQGTKVLVTSGKLAGQQATIAQHPVSGLWQWGQLRWLHFEEHGKHLGEPGGYAVLDEQWYHVLALQVL